MNTAPIDPRLDERLIAEFHRTERTTRARAVVALVAIIALFAACYVMLAQSAEFIVLEWPLR